MTSNHTTEARGFMGNAVCVLAAFALAFSQAQAWWQPAVGTTWQIKLSNPLTNLSQDAQAFDFDLFENTADTIKSIHDKGAKVICYFSAGSYEVYRPDKNKFKSSDLGRPLAHWPGERWVDTNSNNVRRIMKERMDLAVTKGCDAVDPDLIAAYDNGGGGLGLTEADAINYVHFLADEGHKRGLSVGLKNGDAIIPKVLGSVEFSVNEQCLQYNECAAFRAFLRAGKPVFHIEYVKGEPSQKKIEKTCSNPTSQGFSTLIKHLNLDDWSVACPVQKSLHDECGTSTPSGAGRRCGQISAGAKSLDNGAVSHIWASFAAFAGAVLVVIALWL